MLLKQIEKGGENVADLAYQIGMIMLIVAPLLLIFGVPISISMGIPAVLGMFLILGPDKVAITSAQRVFTGINSFSLLAIPFFVLAGVIMNNGGIARRMITFAKALIGFVPGSLAQANVVGNMFFGAVSGSGVAAAAAIGGVMGPIEKEEGYEPAFAAAVNTASAPCGMIIPPSNTFIVYSLASGGASVAALFLAGYIPGVLWGLICMGIAFYFSKKLNYRPSVIRGFGAKFKAFIDAVPALFLIVIIIGGIISGIFTPTEASCVSVVYALFLSFIYRSIRLRDLPGIFLSAARTTGMIMLMIGSSTILSWTMSYTKIPTKIAEAFLSITDNPIIILLMMNFVILIMGCIMDPTPIILIFTPIFLPVALALDINMIHFGVMIVLNTAIGTITPPVGPILFTGCKVAELSIEAVTKYLWPYFIALIVLLMFVTFVPELSLILPGIAGYL